VIVAKCPGLVWLQAERGRREGDDDFLLSVDRLPFDEDGAQQDPEALGPRDAAAGVGTGNELLEEVVDAKPCQEVVDEGERPEPLGFEVDVIQVHRNLLTPAHSCDNTIAGHARNQVQMARSTVDRRKLEQIRKRIAGHELACSGTLHVRTKTCGQKECRCRTSPEHRHGPYYEWTRRRGGRLVHTNLSSEQVEVLKDAIKNYREIQAELQRWELESERIILAMRERNSAR
jgi:hypothetical protein